MTLPGRGVEVDALVATFMQASQGEFLERTIESVNSAGSRQNPTNVRALSRELRSQPYMPWNLLLRQMLAQSPRLHACIMAQLPHLACVNIQSKASLPSCKWFLAHSCTHGAGTSKFHTGRLLHQTLDNRSIGTGRAITTAFPLVVNI
jgi:hypothetical protein